MPYHSLPACLTRTCSFSWSSGDDNDFRAANRGMADETATVGSRLVWLVCMHVVQMALAGTVLGLSAYAVHYVAYSVLVYSVVVVSFCPPYRLLMKRLAC
jgi:hypothetical protein